MRKLLIILFVLPAFCFAQKPDISPLQWNEEEVFHQTILEFEEADSEKLFLASKAVLVDAFKNYSEVVNAEDKDLGLISGRGITSVPVNEKNKNFLDIHFSFKYEIKEGRVRVTFSNFETYVDLYKKMMPLESYTKNAISKKYLENLGTTHRYFFKSLGEQFESMNQSLIDRVNNSDDW